MSSSSNDLLLEILREMVAERGRDQADGITLRALNRQLSDHLVADEKRHRDLEGEVEERHKDLETRVRAVEQTAAEHKGQMDTGRFVLPPIPTPPIIIPSVRSKRPSMPWLDVVKKPAGLILLALATVLAHMILRLMKFL